MVCNFSFTLTVPAVVAAGPTLFTDAVDLSTYEGDDNLVFGVACGTLGGTSPALTYTLQFQDNGDDTDTDNWFDTPFTAVLNASDTSATIQVATTDLPDLHIGNKVRFKVSKANADNTDSAPVAKVFGSKAIAADT